MAGVVAITLITAPRLCPTRRIVFANLLQRSLADIPSGLGVLTLCPSRGITVFDHLVTCLGQGLRGGRMALWVLNSP